MLTIVFRLPGIMRAKGCSDGGSANVRTDLEHIPCAKACEVVGEEQNVHVQHRGSAPDFFQSMAHLVAAVFHQFTQEFQHLICVG